MKTLIIGFIGLFGLALFAADSAWSQQQKPPQPKVPSQVLVKIPGAQGVCNSSDGILVIVVRASGNVTAFQCDKVGQKPIGPQNQIPSGLTVKSAGSLGTIIKWADNTGDPCVTWVISGTSYNYCW